jgi:hypothetical protein
MADQNQQMADIMQQVNYELERYGRLTGSTADALRDAQVGVEGFSQAVRKVPIALTDSVGKMVKTMNSGERGAKVYNDAVSSMADAASAATTVLTAMIPGGPIVKMLVMGLGKLATAAIKAASEVYKLAANQADRQYDAYQAMARAGAAAADGTSQLAEDLLKTSVVLQDLDGYVRLIGENSQDLALFAGSVSRGVQDFTQLSETMKPFRAEFQRLGLNFEQQREATMRFLAVQTRLGNAGRIQAQSYEQTAAAAKRYIEEQDVLTRLTGVERKEREKALLDAMRNQRFAATLDDLERRGKKDEAKALRDSMSLIGEVAGPATAKAFQDAVTGFITPESQKILMASQGVVQEQIALIKEGRVKSDQEFANSNQRMIASLGRASQDFNQLAQIGIFDKIFGPYEESRRAQQFLDSQEQDLNSRLIKIRQDQAKAQAGVDKRLLDQSETRVNQLQTQLNTEKTLNLAVDAVVSTARTASEALLAVSEAAFAAASGLNKVKEESKDFWAKILEFFGISAKPREPTQQERELAAKEEAAREAMLRAEAERKATEAVRKVAEERLAAEQKRLTEAQSAVESAKNQLQGVGTQAGVNFDVQRLERLERAATAKIADAKTPEDRKRAEQDADKIRQRLAAAYQEQSRLQAIVAEQSKLSEAIRLEVAKREADLAEARRVAEVAAAEDKRATQERLKAQAQLGMGGQRPDAQGALAADQRRRERERATTDLDRVTRELRQQRDIMTLNTEKLGKLDKTRDKNQIELLNRVNETIQRKVEELEAEAKVLREKIEANKPQPVPPAQQAPVGTTPAPSGAQPAPPAATQPGTAAPAPAAPPAATRPGTAAPAAAAPARPGPVPSTQRPAAAPPKPINLDQSQLEALGLKIKKGDVQKEGAGIDPRLLKLAKDIQANLKGFVHFTGFNDNFHQENAPGSHTKGLAMDFILDKKPTVAEGKDVVTYLKGLGASLVVDEYNFPSAKSTGGHFHAEVPQIAAYAKGGIIPGPTIALMGEKQPEAVVPLPDGKSIPVTLDTALTEQLKNLSSILKTVDLEAAGAIKENQSDVIRLTQRDVMALGGIGPTMGGYNAYTGYNQGGMTTDLSAVKDIAASVGAFERATQTITNPEVWRKIIESGIATNIQLGQAEFGTKMLPGIANEIGERIKEIVENTDQNQNFAQAMQQVTQEFKSLMQGVAKMGQGDGGRILELQGLLAEMVREQRQTNDINKKMLQVARN